MNRNESAEPTSVSKDAALPTGTAWRVAQALSTLGFLGTLALIAAAPATMPPWAWLVVVALWLVPGAWMIWDSWRSRHQRQ